MTHIAERGQPLFLRPINDGRIFEVLMQAPGCAEEDRTAFLRIVADGLDVIEVLCVGFFDVFRLTVHPWWARRRAARRARRASASCDEAGSVGLTVSAADHVCLGLSVPFDRAGSSRAEFRMNANSDAT